MLPIYRRLRELSETAHSVHLFANGKAIDLLTQQSMNFFATNFVDIGELFDTFGTPWALVTSMCSGGGFGRNVIPFLKGSGCTIFAVQDFWGARMQTDWADPQHRPDYLLVNDQVAVEIAKTAWTDFDPERIVITGSPAFDQLSRIDVAEQSIAVRKQLGLKDGIPIVLFGGQLAGSGEALLELVNVLNTTGSRVNLIARKHPRMAEDAPGEERKWIEALANSTGCFLVDSSTYDPQSLIAAADVVVSMYSTMLVEAAYLRKPNIAILYDDLGKPQLVADTGGVLQEFPPAQLGCTAKAANRHDLYDLVLKALDGTMNLRVAQEQHFVLDGQNADRAATFIREKAHIS